MSEAGHAIHLVGTMCLTALAWIGINCLWDRGRIISSLLLIAGMVAAAFVEVMK
jgi:hypothetical protein